MKFSDTTLQVLTNFSRINNSLMFRAGNTLTTIAPSTAIFASAIIDENIPLDFGIYDMTRFLGVFSVFKEKPELEFGEARVKFSEGRNSVTYVYADPSNIEAAPVGKPKHQDAVFSFSLSDKDFASINKASSALDLPDLSIITDGDKILLKVNDSEDDTSDNFCIELAANETDQKYQLNFKIESLILLPGSYDVDVCISKKEKNSLYASAHFSHTGIDIESWITAETSSKILG